jgi:DnaJ-class molecular chaperone
MCLNTYILGCPQSRESRTCPACSGNGTLDNDEACDRCGGKGWIQQTREATLILPRKVETRECPDCNGIGERYMKFGLSHGEMFDCFKCGGTGKLTNGDE